MWSSPKADEPEVVVSDIKADAEELRAETPASPFLYDTLTEPLTFTIEPSSEPQGLGVKFHAVEAKTGERFFVAYITRHRSLRGLAQYNSIANMTRFGRGPAHHHG